MRALAIGGLAAAAILALVSAAQAEDIRIYDPKCKCEHILQLLRLPATGPAEAGPACARLGGTIGQWDGKTACLKRGASTPAGSKTTGQSDPAKLKLFEDLAQRR